MKLQHLPIGGRFEYEGAVYVKTGPLTAASEEGGQRVIPRYAVLRPVDTSTSQSVVTEDRLSPDRVNQAFEQFYAEAVSLLPVERQPALQTARDVFRATLGI